MNKDEMMDLMEQHLAEANGHSQKLIALVNQAKTNPGGLTPDVLQLMTQYQQAWAAAINRHNEIATQLFGNKEE
jgi:hypothetical protein